MSRQMRMMRQNIVILAIQRQNNIHRRKRKTMWVYPGQGRSFGSNSSL